MNKLIFMTVLIILTEQTNADFGIANVFSGAKDKITETVKAKAEEKKQNLPQKPGVNSPNSNPIEIGNVAGDLQTYPAPKLPLHSDYQPLSTNEVKNYVGKTVYVAVTKGLEDNKYAFSGEPVTIVALGVPGKNNKGRTYYSSVKVKTAEGGVGIMDLRSLSKTRLKYDLMKVTDVEKLIKDLSSEGFEAGLALHDIRKNAQHKDFDRDDPNDMYEMAESLQGFLRFTTSLIQNLTVTGVSDELTILKDPRYRWAAKSTDPRTVKWYADGIKDPSLREKYEGAYRPLADLEGALSFSHDIGNLQDEIDAKPWQRDIKDLSATEKDKIEKMEIDSRQNQIKKSEVKLKEWLSQEKAGMKRT